MAALGKEEIDKPLGDGFDKGAGGNEGFAVEQHGVGSEGDFEIEGRVFGSYFACLFNFVVT